MCLVSIIFMSCMKIPNGNIRNGKIALTFDDNAVDNWTQYLPLLDSLGIKATFFVCKYHTLNDAQKRGLRLLEEHGNEIGYHTSNHLDLVKEVNKSGCARVYRDELKKDLDLMRADGFDPMNFAFPYGSHNSELDAIFLHYFKTVRAQTNKSNRYKCLTGHGGNGQVLHGADIDEYAGMSDSEVEQYVSLANENNDCAVFTAHDINNPKSLYHVDKARLVKIAELVRAKGMQFVLIRDLNVP